MTVAVAPVVVVRSLVSGPNSTLSDREIVVSDMTTAYARVPLHSADDRIGAGAHP